MNLENLYPLIVPSNYYSKGTWDLPHHKFQNEEFILTWVFFGTSSTMSYITNEEFVQLNSNNICWQQIAFENLRNSIGEHENFFTHQCPNKKGNGLKYLAFMNSDGIGSSRLLLSFELLNAFNEGYYLAFPDRSCGLVIPSSISPNELKSTIKLIKKMHKGATIPMSSEIYRPEDFLLPEEWTVPLDKNYSEILTNEIKKII